MSRLTWKPGTMLYPLPAVLISCGDFNNSNIVTVAWTGTVCTDPAMVYISLRKERHSYNIIKKSKEFVINLSTEDLVYATDFCGVKSGRDINKFERLKLTKIHGKHVKAPMIEESPVNIECEVVSITPLGSHDMFLAKVLAVNVDEKYLDEKNKFNLNKSKPICYSHGQYYNLNKSLGGFGFSVRKVKKKRR